MGKKILLLSEMASHIGWMDRGLISDLITGFPILGTLPRTGGVFPPRHRPSTIPIETLLKQAKQAQAQAMAECGPSAVPERDRTITEGTQEEEDNGWLSPPLTA